LFLVQVAFYMEFHFDPLDETSVLVTVVAVAGVDSVVL